MISVIVPVYNAQNYIERCLDSIIAQTYSELEIICVDDGSTDDSAQICKEYAEKDKRIHYHYIDNGGVSNARNYALKLVTGEWFAFVDSDDWIEPDFYEVLLNNAVNNGCEISACQFQQNAGYAAGYEGGADDISVCGSPDECIHSFICGGRSLQGQVWNKIYLTEKFRHIEFDTDIKVNEDCLYTYRVMKGCSRACVCDAELYHWYMREDSACHNKNDSVNLAPANVFLKLDNDTAHMDDAEIRSVLMMNYARSLLKILFDAKKAGNEADIRAALMRLKKEKKNIWCGFSVKEKLKYYCVILKYII